MNENKTYKTAVCFNSSKVQLEPGLSRDEAELRVCFNSSKVQLELSTRFLMFLLTMRFNSSKVQLEHEFWFSSATPAKVSIPVRYN